MKILLTGSNGYIGKQLLISLLQKNHHIIAMVRNKATLSIPDGYAHNITIWETDLLQQTDPLPDTHIDAAYYLIHSMAQADNFDELEQKAAHKFVEIINTTTCKQIIYLTGLSDNNPKSKHLQSRENTKRILQQANCPLTTLKAGIIIGAGSASFEIIRDLVEKLPIMIAPKWLSKKCQPIAVHDVIEYLVQVLGKEEAYDQEYDIGGPDVLTYKEMLLEYADIRHLKRYILSIPVLTPRLSSYWLVFITTTNYRLARHLIDSITSNTVCHEHNIQTLIPGQCLPYREAVQRALINRLRKPKN